MSNLEQLFKKNKAWAQAMTAEQPDFFTQLSKQQKPEYLWIGCADSRVPANEIIDLLPGEVFVHRNIANMVVHSDLNCLSVIQFAVDVLKVKHIMVVGHYGCGGIKAALESKERGAVDLGHVELGLIENWLNHIKDVYRLHEHQLDLITDKQEKFDRLCELNVIEQVANVCQTNIVQKAWKNKQELHIHGWIYSIKNGLIKDLEVTVSDRTIEPL